MHFILKSKSGKKEVEYAERSGGEWLEVEQLPVS